ncbi:DC-STAMP domain-containing protein 2-like isoform X2 [Maniola jurtina]|uniref:DC-STAMP domain-containing protein 2-like isoform X2 n=1 Tax=Maniola jurtina TaxID=191418 RepID=UPI001E68CA67|nr:DC-STAMP domain-containing protein 2-like isoform X2 [Maniola jurtina]
MAYFTSLWKARIIENCKKEYEDEKINSILTSNINIPRKTTSMMQKWRIYRRETKTRLTGKLKKLFPDGSSVSNLYFYLKTDQMCPDIILKSVVGFFGGIVLTYLCFVFFVFQLSISLIHATIMSSVIGVLLTLGLAFSYRIRCLVFLLIPQLFSRVGRYTLTCYALVLILTGPATNTFKNSEVLSESMACSQEQIKTSVREINESMKKPFNAMKDTVMLMVETIKRLTSTLDENISRISVLVIGIADVIQSSLSWLNSVGNTCNEKFGTPYDYCLKAVDRGVLNCKKTFKGDLSWLCSASFAAKSACWSVRPFESVCFIADYATTTFAATVKRKLRDFTDRINRTLFVHIETQHTYTFTSNASHSASQVAAGIVTELRNRADPLLTWLSWSSCVTSLFLLLIIFRAKYYQHMFETRSRFDNRYVTQELRELDLKRYREGRETILPLNRREQAKYINVTSFRLVTSEKLYLTRTMVFMVITTFKLLIHIVADYSLYWVLITIRYHGRSQTLLPPGPSNAGVQISGHGIVADFIRSIFNALTLALVQNIPSPVACLPNPYPPDFQRYTQIAVLIMLLWFFALFEPYGLRLRHVIMGHYRPERARTRAVWLYNHILRTRGSFMKLARRKLHREYKYSDQENLTFRHWINSLLPCWCLRYIFGTLPKEPHCLLCNALEEEDDSDMKLITCKMAKCPGVYCTRCFCDIGHLCTICLPPEDYGDISDISLEKGSSDESSDQEYEDSGDHNSDDAFAVSNDTLIVDNNYSNNIIICILE